VIKPSQVMHGFSTELNFFLTMSRRTQCCRHNSPFISGQPYVAKHFQTARDERDLLIGAQQFHHASQQGRYDRPLKLVHTKKTSHDTLVCGRIPAKPPQRVEAQQEESTTREHTRVGPKKSRGMSKTDRSPLPSSKHHMASRK
jgi:hypothetical protein